jgi:hypothetical protein
MTVARNWFIRMSLFVCLAAPLAGQTDEWQKYKNEAGNFSALFPGEPTDSLNGDQSSGVSHLIQFLSGHTGYSVVYVNVEEEQTVDDDSFNLFRDSFFKSLSACDRLSEDPLAFPIRGYVGRSYHLNCNIHDNKQSSVLNLYLGKHHDFFVMVIFPTADSIPPGVKKFTDSFAVLDSSK